MTDPKPPPSYEDSLEGISRSPTEFELLPSERSSFVSFGALTDTEMKEACYEYVAENCCYGSSFIRDMILTDIYNGYSFIYKLETFTERRESDSTHTSYHGETIDGPENGPPPDPWDIRVEVPTKFKDDWIWEEIPHTAYVKRCYKCSGDGRICCSYCKGFGTEDCSSCRGSGRDSEDSRCSSCRGSGTRPCSSCRGSGKEQCSPCNGSGKLKHYEELIVKWQNHTDDFISDTMGLPPDLIKDVSGREIFKEEFPQVQPISHAPNNLVNEASARLVNAHKRAFPSELQLMQRHTLWAIPITRGTYVWKKKQGEFYVYGFQKKVYFENYPQKCCCCTCC